MSDKQFRYVYQLMADNFSANEVKTLYLIKWSGTKVITRVRDKDSQISHLQLGMTHRAIRCWSLHFITASVYFQITSCPFDSGTS